MDNPIAWTFTTKAVEFTGQTPVSLGKAGPFAILTKSGITDVFPSVINGDVGASPITGAAIHLKCSEIKTGTVYSVNKAGPLPCRVTDPPNGFSVSRRRRSRPSHSITSAANGSLGSRAARSFVRDCGLRTMKVPAVPTFTTSYSLSAPARTLGRKVRCPPTLTPRRKTTRAIPRIMKKNAETRYSGLRLQVDGLAPLPVRVTSRLRISTRPEAAGPELRCRCLVAGHSS